MVSDSKFTYGKIGLILFILFCRTVMPASAQTAAEWLRQKKTQKKYLLEQIAALKVYGGYLQDGYKIAKDGLGSIGGFTGGEFRLHGSFFDGLEKVHPAIKGDARIADAEVLHERTLGNITAIHRFIQGEETFSSDERAFLLIVVGRVVDDGGQKMEELALVIADGRMKMDDDDRLKRLSELHGALKANHLFTESLKGNLILFARTRLQSKEDIRKSRVLHGLKD